MELQGKTFALLEYGYNLGALYVAKTDDDVCLEPDALLQGLENYETNRSDGDALYGGYAYFKGQVISSGKTFWHCGQKEYGDNIRML